MALPLNNKRIVLTRAAEQSAVLAARLRELDAIPLICPAIEFTAPHNTVPLDTALRRLAQYDWALFTSANAVRFTLERLRDLKLGPAELAQAQIAAVGPSTARALEVEGLHAQLVAHEHSAEGLLAALVGISEPPAAEFAMFQGAAQSKHADHLITSFADPPARRFLLPTSDLARELLADELRMRGAQVDQVVAYRTIPGPGAALLAPILRAGSVDATIFSSPSAVHFLLAGLGSMASTPEPGEARPDLPEAPDLTRLGAIICIGPTTAAAAQQARLRVNAIAAEASDEAVIAALLGR